MLYSAPVWYLLASQPNPPQMLAYGRSQRTLRFFHQDELTLDPLEEIEDQLRIEPSEPGKLVSANLELPAGVDNETTPCPAKAIGAKTVSRHNLAAIPNPSHLFQADFGGNPRGTAADMESAGDRGGGRAEGGEPVKARRRFRLDMDLGSDSDSSTEQDSLPCRGGHGRGPVQGKSSASKLRHQASPAAGQQRHQHRGGITNSYGQIPQGDDDDSGTTFRSSDFRSRGNSGGKERWQEECNVHWEEGRDVGRGCGPGGQFLDNARETSWSQAQFVTPDHAGNEPHKKDAEFHRCS